jgi:two-component system, sensor histidine kinase
MSRISFKSIRTSLLYLVILIFIPFFAIIYYSAHQQKQEALRFATVNAMRVARNLSEQQKFIENNTRQFLSVLAQLPEIKSNDTTGINDLLALLLRQNPSYASLLLINNHGDMVASGVPFTKLNVSDRKYFIDAMQTKTFSVGEYTRSRITSKPVIHYAFPILRADNSIKSILAVAIDLKYYDKIFATSNLGQDAAFTFVDHNGIVMYHSPNISVLTGETDQPEVLNQIQTQKSEGSFIAQGTDGITRLYGYKQLNFTDNKPYMYIYVGIPEKLVYTQYNANLTLNIIIWVVAILLIILMAYIFSHRNIIRPIDRLVKTARMVAEGNLGTRTGISDQSTELGKLAGTIDGMTEKLLLREVERKRAEKEIKKLKERFELAVNSANIGIWDWHLRNNNLVWDKNMFELYGTTPEKFNDTFEAWKEFIHKDDIVYLEAEISNAIEYHRPFRSEFRIHHPMFGLKYIRIFANIINDKEGEPVRLIGVNWDMTERKILERKLNEAREKAETSDRLKSSFLANISHEIRTPLHGIIGFAQIIKDNNISQKELAQYLDIIVDSGNKLMNIISNIIDISMLDAGQLKMMRRKSNLYEVVRNIYDSFEVIRVRENKSFALILEAEISKDIYMSIDNFRFNQIFSNLLDNAFKFTEKGEIHIGCRIFNNELLCYVKDTGIGVSSENLLKIFDRFKQVNEGADREYSGNGLGLAICKGMVELMGGRIWAISKVNGSEFYFNIPIKEAGDTDTALTESEMNQMTN